MISKGVSGLKRTGGERLSNVVGQHWAETKLSSSGCVYVLGWRVGCNVARRSFLSM